MAFLDRLAEVFGLDERAYGRIRARHLHPADGDPYEIIGASRDWEADALKAQYRKLVKENHPDSLIARGVPEEFVTLANDRLAVINHAWESIRRERAL
jgi:DnaJ like chaperone protein